MTFHDPETLAQDFVAVFSDGAYLGDPFPLGDRYQRLLEAGTLDCCPEGDFLSLMSSIEGSVLRRTDGKAWLRRILGI